MKPAEFFKINFKLLPFKTHYFVFYGALAGVFPFIPVFSKQLGIPAAAFGIIYSVLPFCSFISKPFFGFLADYFQNIKAFLVALIILISATLMSLLLIPPIVHDSGNATIANLELRINELEVVIEGDGQNVSCFPLKSRISCQFHSGQWNESTWYQLPCRTKLKWHQVPEYESSDDNVVLSDELNQVPSLRRETLTLSFDDKSLENFHNSCDFHFSKTVLLNCTSEDSECSVTNSRPSVYDTYQYWLLVALLLLPGGSANACMSLADVACCEALGKKREMYGRQRLWGTISWGLACALTGFLNDTFSTDGKNFSPGFYLMLTLLVIDVLLIMKIDLTKTKLSSNMCEDIRKIIGSTEMMTFAFGVFLVGILTSLLSTYEFWFLEDMGASQSLLGMAVAMQCLVGEVPLLFFSGWLIRKLGYFNCLALSFSGFALRFCLYSILRNPWFVLPIDTLHGLTFAVFHATMTSFASAKAPSGLEATALGFMGGLSDGLGNGIGSFLGGMGFKMLGSRMTFFSASVISFCCIPAFIVAPKILNKFPAKEYARPQETDIDGSHDLKQAC